MEQPLTSMENEHTETVEGLYEIIAESSLEYGHYRRLLQELEETGYVIKMVTSDDIILYRARPGLKWSNICDLSDPYKKKIILPLIENPKTFFVLFNTQKGKLRIAGGEMAQWSIHKEKRVVSFLIVDNDKTLSEQSVNGLFDCFEKVEGHEAVEKYEDKYKVKIYELSSNNKTSLEEIKIYIDAYAYNRSRHMPLIVILANNKQMEKFMKLLHYIKHHESGALCAGIIWDEADKIYPLYREKQFKVGGQEMAYIDFIQKDDNKTIYRTGFVTATDGPLLEDDYEECCNAYHYPVDIPDDVDYRAIHHPESVLNILECRRKDSNNNIAEKLISEKWDEHFQKPLRLANGEPYYRKTIINSNSKSEDMKKFALSMVEKGGYALTFNQYGILLYTPSNKTGKKYTTRRKRFGQVLFYIYKMNRLHDRPIFIIGRRKVDRGLGFHYAPRRSWGRVTTIEGPDGFCMTDGLEGLIWTDLILGNRIDDLASAVQKVGRGAGIIAQCPQYPGSFTYWLEQENADDIITHYRKVDKVNRLQGANSMLQAVERAKGEIPVIRRNHNVDPNTYRVVKGTTPAETLEIMKNIITKVFGGRFRTPKEQGGYYITSLNTKTEKVSLLNAVSKVPTAYGTNEGTKTYRNFYPCYSKMEDPASLYCVIPLIDPSYTERQKTMLDADYNQYFHLVPKEGSLEHL